MHVGWDWATETHDVTVMDGDGGVVDRWDLTHDEVGLAATLSRLARLGEPHTMVIAIEATHSLVIDRLLAAGHPVVPIHPNSFHAVRARWGASKAKSDPGDSYKLADYLRTDGHRLRRLEPLSTAAADLQALVRARDDQMAAKLAATNQLRAMLERHWPGAVRIFARLDSDIALAFLADYPTPTSTARLGEQRMAMFCRRHSYSGRRTPAELLTRLHAAAQPTEAISSEVLTELVCAQVRHLRCLLTGIADLDRAISAALLDQPRAQLLAPLPRIGEINLAQVLAEIGPILDRAVDVDQACAEVGAVPVTRASGKHTGVTFRWAANTRARQALMTFADNSRHASPWAANAYTRARARGKRHPHAIRILARAWMRVIWACWHTNTAYDPTRHGNEQRLTAA